MRNRVLALLALLAAAPAEAPPVDTTEPLSDRSQAGPPSTGTPPPAAQPGTAAPSGSPTAQAPGPKKKTAPDPAELQKQVDELRQQVDELQGQQQTLQEQQAALQEQQQQQIDELQQQVGDLGQTADQVDDMVARDDQLEQARQVRVNTLAEVGTQLTPVLISLQDGNADLDGDLGAMASSLEDAAQSASDAGSGQEFQLIDTARQMLLGAQDNLAHDELFGARQQVAAALPLIERAHTLASNGQAERITPPLIETPIPRVRVRRSIVGQTPYSIMNPLGGSLY